MDSQKVSKGWNLKTKKWGWRPSPMPHYAHISAFMMVCNAQRRIIISIYHSIDIWEEFSTTGVFSTENRSAYRRRWENYRWCDALIWIKFKSPIRADEPRLLRRIYVNIYQIIFACPSSQDEVAFGIVFTTIQMHNNTVPCNNQLRTRKDYAAINNMQQSTWTV